MENEKQLQTAKEVFQATVAITDERYGALLTDLQDIVKMTVRICRDEVIKSKWEVGNRIVQEFEDKGNTQYRGIIKRLSEDLKVSESELYRCVEFREKCTTEAALEEFVKVSPEGENLSWNKIKDNYLPQGGGVQGLTLAFPQVDSLDKWGLLEWWEANTDKNFVLVIKDPKYATQLKVTAVKVKEEQLTPLKEAFRVIRDHFLYLKKWDLKDLDASDYARINRVGKHLLLKAKGDINKIKKAMDWVASRGYEEWTMETVLKKYPDAVRKVPAYEKYMKKGESNA
jgi:hypothetical protein